MAEGTGQRGEPAACTFFDLDALLEAGGAVPRLRHAVEAPVLAAVRRGVLANVPVDVSAADVRATLGVAGIDALFEDDLVVVASALGCPMPDRRAFTVAAALAGEPIGACAFVSLDPARQAAAAEAGMVAIEIEGAPMPPAGGSLRAGPPPAGLFRAGEIDEDTGPTFVLHGRVVTMDDQDRVHDSARVVVERGHIVRILSGNAKLPAAYANVPQVETGGTIYPGLIDLHNHFVYNVLPFWPVTRAWTNCTEWARDPGYGAEISLPIHLLASSPRASRAIVRYIEAKALVGGTTTGQGIRTQVRGGARLFRGAMRNVEETNDPRLPEAGTLVPNLGRRDVDFAAFRASLDKRAAAGGVYFYHLAEGTNELARRTYTDLQDHDLLQPALVGIHSLALTDADLRRLAEHKSRVVWSPFSNLLLYGRTLDLQALTEAGALFSLGCDWSPTGSKNLLEELKVARFEVLRQGAALDDKALVAAVTRQPANVLGWGTDVGSLVEGAFADMLVVHGSTGDPYSRLVDAVEADISLVVTHGVARYGVRAMVEALTPAGLPVERWRLDGADRGFQLGAPESGLDDLTFAAAHDLLAEAASDLHAFRDALPAEQAQARARGFDPDAGFTLLLDNEAEDPDGALRAGPEAAAVVDLPASFELDEPWVGAGTYWDRLDRQHNVSEALRTTLRTAYGAPGHAQPAKDADRRLAMTGTTGIALHIGLNRVDPAHYSGWDGTLMACEADANDMYAISSGRGLTASRLLTADATSAAVTDAITDAASRLRAGDLFVLSYSGHGGQVTDVSGDEADGLDETWVLYDRQLLDDELYALWAGFAPGVRILVLSDSCHSGSVVRDAFYAASPANQGPAPRFKFMPRDVRVATYEAHRAMYDGIQQALGVGEQGEVGATVLLISGCQDNQYSRDGDRNGLFTQQLRAVWDDGKFAGSHRDLFLAISQRMPPDQTPNFLPVGRTDRDFEKATPFTV